MEEGLKKIKRHRITITIVIHIEIQHTIVKIMKLTTI
jgi:hypothetical protein